MVRGARPHSEARERIALQHIVKAIRGVRFGVITIIVQDGVVIQIDQTEKKRLDYLEDNCQEGSGI